MRLGGALVRGLVAASLGLAGCARKPLAPPVARNLVLVTIDTLRADRVGCYGNATVETPHLDALARDGAMAPEASAQVPLTRPSHLTILTGLYPSEHGIRDNVSPALDESIPTLPRILKGAGFTTGGFVSSVVLASQSGLARGFDVYSDKFEIGPNDARFLNTIQRRGDLPTGEAIAWLQGQKDHRFFLWLHLYDPHEPYEPPEPYASRYRDRPYDGEVAFADDLVGRLDAALGALGVRDETLVAVTSDHGEGLGEHGESVHGFFVYQTTLRVPLVLRGPGIPRGTRLPVTARSVDLVPTLLDFVGVASPGHLSGRDLAPALRGAERPAEEASYAESLLPLIHYGWSDLRALREGRWKYIQAPRPELYDLLSDPGEAHDLARGEPSRVQAFRTAMDKRLEAERSLASRATNAAAVPEDLLEKLGALGYVGAGAAPGEGETGADPKDKIEDFKVLNSLVREGIVALREKDYPKSVASFRDVLARKVESFEVHYYLGKALLGQGDAREALAHFRKAADRLPAYGPAYVAQADSLMKLQDSPGALAALAKGESAAPRDPTIFERKAQILRRGGRADEASRAYETAIGLAPANPLLKVELGELLRDHGGLDRAVVLLQEAVKLDPESPSYWNSLGRACGVKGDMPGAEAAFREAFRLEPGNAEYAFNVGLALEREGRVPEALDFYGRSARLDPAFRAPRERIGSLR
jgi:arylsulfatase A-like enzyme/Flp pilus assembly protein TadD